MVIRVENLCVEYRVGRTPLKVLDVPSWEVGPGEQVAITGPSGCGKSTLLHVLGGLLRPDAGSVEVCGRDLTQLGEAERDRWRAAHMGFIFQSFNLLQGYTALENVLLGLTFAHGHGSRAEAKARLEDLGMGHRLHHRPAQLSIGEQQRVAIARALVKHPELILADEPTGSLDPRNADEVVKQLVAACHHEGCTLVLVSHQTAIAGAFEKRIDFLELNAAFASAAGGAGILPAGRRDACPTGGGA